MSIVSRLRLLVLSVSSVYVIALAICVWGLLSVGAGAEKLLSGEAQVLLLLEKLNVAALQSGQATRNVMLNPDDAKAVENYRQALAEFNQSAGLLGKHAVADPELKKQHEEISKAWEDDNRLKEQIQQMALSGNQVEARKLLNEKETPQWRALKELLSRAKKQHEDKLSRARSEMSQSARSILYFALGCAIIGASGGLVVFILVMRSITRRLNSVIDGLSAITNGGGDLTRDLPVNGNDEITRLSREANTLISWLRGMVGDLSRQGEQVAVKVCEMTRTTHNTVQSAATQKEQAVAVAVAAEEMASTLNGVADNTHNAAGVASHVNQAASSGMEAVERACNCMEGIRESVENTRGTVERLNVSSEKIGEIAGMIEDIADQTNLLALNAAIEAARAGENGRGFAVVADEVKNLSAKTAASTREITEIIGAIRKEGQQALTAMNEEYARVAEGVTTAQEARGVLSNILGLAGESTDMINQIATATEEQSVVTSEITEKIQHISSMAQNVNNQMVETENTLLRLSETAEQIFSSVGCFSVGTYHDEKRAVAQRFRDKVVETLEKAVSEGQISMDQLFSRNYTPIAGTDPQKYTTAYDKLFEKIISPIQEEVFSANPGLATSTVFDDRAYLPCHLLKFSQPLTGNKEVDRVNNRSKLIFDDRVSIRACKNTDPFLMQTFMRVTGEIIIDIACPVFVRGRHWGAVRIGYSPSGN